MSFASVCHGMQSCLEPQCNLQLMAAQSKPNFPQPSSPVTNPLIDFLPNNNKDHVGDDKEVESSFNAEKGGWSFFKYLSKNANSNQNVDETETKNKVYLHPLTKEACSQLSEISLEMCTESLGSETGDGIIYNMEERSFLSEESRNLCAKFESLPQLKDQRRKKFGSTMSYPPPIASISGSKGRFRVKPYREGGRLVLQAINVPSSLPLFHAERFDGRLKLCMFKENEFTTVDEEQEEGEAEEEEEGGDIEDEEEGIDANSEEFGGEMGIENFNGLSRRCKERGNGSGGKVVLNWEPFLVAT